MVWFLVTDHTSCVWFRNRNKLAGTRTCSWTTQTQADTTNLIYIYIYIYRIAPAANLEGGIAAVRQETCKQFGDQRPNAEGVVKFLVQRRRLHSGGYLAFILGLLLPIHRSGGRLVTVSCRLRGGSQSE
jgi:hypothetical protein